jgi:DNA-binding CsgD family transcriptional regulator
MTNRSVISPNVLAFGSNDYSIKIIKNLTDSLKYKIEFKSNLNELFFISDDYLSKIDFLIIATCSKTINRHDLIDKFIRFFNGLPVITILEYESNMTNHKDIPNKTLLNSTDINFTYELRAIFPAHGNFLISNMPKIAESFRNISKVKSDQLWRLTKREEELLMLLAKGYSYKSCATSMNISLSTVQAHIRNLYSKLNVNNNRSAVSKALGLQVSL